MVLGTSCISANVAPRFEPLCCYTAMTQRSRLLVCLKPYINLKNREGRQHASDKRDCSIIVVSGLKMRYYAKPQALRLGAEP